MLQFQFYVSPFINYALVGHFLVIVQALCWYLVVGTELDCALLQQLAAGVQGASGLLLFPGLSRTGLLSCPQIWVHLGAWNHEPAEDKVTCLQLVAVLCKHGVIPPV